VLAPTNAAFGNVDAYVLEYLSSNEAALKEVLTYHVIPLITDVSEGEFATVNGDVVSYFTDISIETADILVSNGVIHVISAVLVPPSLVIPPPPETTSGGYGPLHLAASSFVFTLLGLMLVI